LLKGLAETRIYFKEKFFQTAKQAIKKLMRF